MATQKITEKQQTESLHEEASVLVTQKETIEGVQRESVRRATLAAVVAADRELRLARGLFHQTDDGKSTMTADLTGQKGQLLLHTVNGIHAERITEVDGAVRQLCRPQKDAAGHRACEGCSCQSRSAEQQRQQTHCHDLSDGFHHASIPFVCYCFNMIT